MFYKMQVINYKGVEIAHFYDMGRTWFEIEVNGLPRFFPFYELALKYVDENGGALRGDN